MNEIDDLIDNLDFKSIRKAMKALEWRYYDSDECPTIERLKGIAGRLLTEAYIAVRDGGQKKSSLGSGGFQAKAERHKKSGKIYLSIMFVLEEENNAI